MIALVTRTVTNPATIHAQGPMTGKADLAGLQMQVAHEGMAWL